MYGKHSAKLFNGWQKEFTKDKSLRNPLNRYENMGNVHDGRLGTPVINPFDGAFGDAGPAPDPMRDALQSEVADAGAAIAKASHLIATDPHAGHIKLKVAQDRLASAAAKLSAHEAKKRSPSPSKAMPKAVLLLLIALAAVSGYMFFKDRR